MDDKYTPIHNNVLEALCRVRLTAYESCILFCIWRYTYGFESKKGGRLKMNNLSLSYISKATDIPRQHVSRTITGLIKRGLVVRENGLTGFSKNFMKVVPSEGLGSPSDGTRVVPPQGLG